MRIQRLAELDLLAIWEYSFQEWGAAHADRYLDSLDQRIRALARNPALGKSRDEVRKGYRALCVNRHTVYYTVSSEAIQIIRVLHGQMDPYRYL